MFAPVPHNPRYSSEWWRVGEEERIAEERRQQQAANEAEVGRRDFHAPRP